jgi:hypothetical protein
MLAEDGRSSCVHLLRRTIESNVPVVEYLILFVEKVARLTPWEYVTHIFCRAPDGAIRKMMYYKAIRHVEEGTARFYVIHQERQVELELAHDASGNECLRSTIDGQKIDVLLSLPDYRNGG